MAKTVLFFLENQKKYRIQQKCCSPASKIGTVKAGFFVKYKQIKAVVNRNN